MCLMCLIDNPWPTTPSCFSAGGKITQMQCTATYTVVVAGYKENQHENERLENPK